MEVQEVVKAVENLQANVSAGIVVILYYLLLKLRIEIEKIKKDSGLDSELLEKLELEMQSRLEEKKNTPFTNLQKFVAIPLVILVILQSFLEIHAIDKDFANTVTSILSGAVFIITTVIVGFWGIPVLKKQQKGWLRKAGFIAFWTFGFYIIVYVLIFVYASLVLDVEQLADATLGLIFLSSLVCSLILGMMGRLPFMRRI